MKFLYALGLLAAVCAADLCILRAARVMGDRDFRAVQETNARMTWETAAHASGDAAEKPASSVQKEAKGFIALTFDDGPHGEDTARLLDGLAARGIKASFFLMGQSIPGQEELVRRMKDEGHLIGSHSYGHTPLTELSGSEAAERLEETSRLIEEVTGEAPEYVRPPYGKWSDALEEQADMTPVFWSVDSMDWKLKDRNRIVDRVLKDAGNGDIILMHDIFPQSVDAALELADRLSGEGYVFVTVDEMLVD